MKLVKAEEKEKQEEKIGRVRMRSEILSSSVVAMYSTRLEQ